MAIRAAAFRAQFLLALAAWLWPAVPAAAATGPSLPRVYVYTDVARPGQPAPADQAARQASVRDVRQELRKKPGLLELVATPGDAQVTVEVVGCESAPAGRCLLTARLRVAGRTSGRQFQGEGGTCGDSAVLVADAIRRWVNETY
jgi:hypothetical protein